MLIFQGVGNAPEKWMVGKLNILTLGPGKFSGANLLLVLGKVIKTMQESWEKNLQQMFENENGSNTVQHICTTQQTKISCLPDFWGPHKVLHNFGSLWIRYFGGKTPKFHIYTKHDDLENVSPASNMAILSIYVKFLGRIQQPSIGWSLYRLASKKKTLSLAFPVLRGLSRLQLFAQIDLRLVLRGLSNLASPSARKCILYLYPSWS